MFCDPIDPGIPPLLVTIIIWCVAQFIEACAEELANTS